MFDATPFLRLYARHRLRRLGRMDPAETQRRTLLRLVAKARNTRFGRDHGFAEITDVGDFQRRTPLRRYEEFWAEYWEGPFPVLTDCSWPGTVPYFAVTSGTTTGITNNIPCTTDMMRSNSRASLDLLTHHLANRPRSRILAGRSFMLGGSTELIERAPGVFSGDLSGIAAGALPLWARPFYFPPPELALLADWEEKVERLAHASLAADIRSLSGTPSWLLIFLDRLAAITGGGLTDAYPDLELLIHGGVNFAPYRRRFEELLAGGHAELREVYPASEGFFGVADRGPGDGMRLLLDTGLFYEFIPVEELDADRPTRCWIGDVERGVNYAIAVSTCAGLWAYVVGDTVEFVDTEIPRVLVTGRTAYTLSAFGEHLIDAEIEEAIAQAAEAINATVTDYSVGALMPDGDSVRGGHLYIVEFADPAPDADRLAAFAETLDAALCRTNEDYEAHRAGGYGLDAPRVHGLAPGRFAAWMKSRGKLGGQNKVPRIITDDDLFRALRDFAGC